MNIYLPLTKTEYITYLEIIHIDYQYVRIFLGCDYMGLKNETVCLESNFMQWKNMFECEKKFLLKFFNRDDILIEHVGSTSVEGLLAKPIVDIAVGVDNFKDIKTQIDILKKRYTVKNNDASGEILLIKENISETFCLIHILNRDSDRFKNMIRFRDMLKNNYNILKQYEELKKHLSSIYPNNRKMYTELKNNFIEEVLENNNIKI